MSGITALNKAENIAELARSFPPTQSTPEEIAGRREERRKRIDAAKASQQGCRGCLPKEGMRAGNLG